MTAGIQTLEHRDAGAAIRRLAVPNALAIASDQLLGIVDTIVIGTLGTAALAGITGATSVFLVVGIGMYAFGSGLRIIGAQAIGARRSERFGTIVRSSIVVPLAIALGVAAAASFLAAPILRIVLPATAPLGPSAQYLALRTGCLIPMVFTNQLIVAFATAGDTRLAFRALLVINAVHIPLVLVLAHRFGLAGAGTSSLAAETIGLGYVVFATARRPELGVFASWRVDGALVRATASLSWPEFVFLMLQILPEPVAIALLAPGGAQLVAAFRALSIVSDITWSIPGSLGDACETIIGQRIGAGDYAGARAFNRAAIRLGVIVCACVGGAVAVLAWPLAALCTLSAALANLAALPLAAHTAVTLPLKGFAMTALAPIRASGDTRWVMRMGLIATALSISCIAFGIIVLHAGLWAIPFGWTVSWVFRCALTRARVRGGDWERRRLAHGG